MILVGDIGGTNARFAIAIETDNRQIVISDYEKFKTREFTQFDELLKKFVHGIKHKPQKAIQIMFFFIYVIFYNMSNMFKVMFTTFS